MKFKKVLSAVLVAATCVSLCACGGGKKDGGSDGGDGAIQVAIWDNIQLDGLKEIAAGFTEETGVDVEFQVVPGMSTGRFLKQAQQAVRCQTYFGCTRHIPRDTCPTTSFLI